ncbi:MAG: aminotransferase class III-fold pyridoxal phosphate-dependent enzyme, partial [Bacteroidota bacterium]
MKQAVNQGENIRLLKHDAGNDAPTRALIERDSAVFYHQTLSTPVFNAIDRAEGAYIYDTAGNQYLDLHGNGVHTVGYNNPAVLEAMRRQMDEALTFAPRRFTNLPAVLLAEKLAAIAPAGLDRVLFCPGGSEAIEMATMLAKHYTGKWKTLSYYGTFHGAGFQAVSIGADPHFREGLGPMMPGAIHLELPDYYRNPWGWTDQEQIDDEYIRQLELQFMYNPDIAALVSEPIFFNSTVPTRTYWERVKALCAANGALLIFDEIYTAFGRTGRMFASEHFVSPDIIVVGKGFGGGVLPFAGIIGRSELNVIDHRSIGHYTHEKNPLCCAVSKAVIDFVENQQLVQHAETLGAFFKSGLEVLQDEFETIGHVSGLGLNLAVDLVKDPTTKERATQEAHQLMEFCLQRGVSFKLIQGNILNLKPALVVTKAEIEYVLETLREG